VAREDAAARGKRDGPALSPVDEVLQFVHPGLTT
jgi:hypothetical protein